MNCIVWIIYNIKLCDFNITWKVQLYSFLLLFNTSAMDKRPKGGGSVTIFLIYLVLYNTFLIKCSVCILGLFNLYKLLQVQQERKFVLPC